MAIPIIIIGGGGHSLSVADIILSNKNYQLLGYIDQNKEAKLSSLGLSWLGNDCEISKTKAKAAHIGVGQIKSPELRHSLFRLAKTSGLIMPSIISSSAMISKSATLGEGVLVMHKAVVNPIALVGLNSIINTAAVIEHGATIGEHCHIAPNATILGEAIIGDKCFIGSGAIILEGVKIGRNSIIGAGAVIKHDLSEGSTIKGTSQK